MKQATFYTDMEALQLPQRGRLVGCAAAFDTFVECHCGAAEESGPISCVWSGAGQGEASVVLVQSQAAATESDGAEEAGAQQHGEEAKQREGVQCDAPLYSVHRLCGEATRGRCVCSTGRNGKTGLRPCASPWPRQAATLRISRSVECNKLRIEQNK
jgi:hypothetical protein